MTHCDCLNRCGDDPWLHDGRAEACEHLVSQREADKLFEVQQLRRQVLYDFYAVNNIVDLVEAMAADVARLHAKLAFRV
jgi:hypothetical protein